MLLNFGAGGYVTDMSESFGAVIGHWIAPFFAPVGLGFWQIAVALIAGISAKEVVVSSCAVLFGIVNASSPEGMVEFSAALGLHRLRQPERAVPHGVLPAVHTLHGHARDNTRSSVVTAAFQLAVAWVVTLLVYQIGRLVI